MEARRVAAFDWQNHSLLNSLRKKESAKPLQRFNLAVPSPGRGTIEIACGSEEFNPPFPFPSRASRGGVGSPDAGGTLRGNKSGWLATMLPAPPQEGCRPLVDPLRARWSSAWTGPNNRMFHRRKSPENRADAGITYKSNWTLSGGRKKQRKAATAVLT